MPKLECAVFVVAYPNGAQVAILPSQLARYQVNPINENHMRLSKLVEVLAADIEPPKRYTLQYNSGHIGGVVTINSQQTLEGAIRLHSLAMDNRIMRMTILEAFNGIRRGLGRRVLLGLGASPGQVNAPTDSVNANVTTEPPAAPAMTRVTRSGASHRTLAAPQPDGVLVSIKRRRVSDSPSVETEVKPEPVETEVKCEPA